MKYQVKYRALKTILYYPIDFIALLLAADKPYIII